MSDENDAGAIRGRLDLNIVSFKDGFSEAHTHAETKVGQIRELVESLTAVLDESLGPAIGGIGNDFQSMAAGFAEGPIIGSLGVISTAVGALRENVDFAAERIESIAHASERLGVSTEYLSRLGAAAGVVGISTDTLAGSLKLLNLHIGEVAEGADKKGVGAFAALGISQQDLQAHLDDTSWVIDKVVERLDAMHLSASKRAPILRDILGRGGENLTPLFELGEGIKKIGDFADESGATVTAADAKAAESFAMLREEVKLTFEGLSKEVAMPFLVSLQQNLPAIETGLKGVTADLRELGAAAATDVGVVGNLIVDLERAAGLHVNHAADDWWDMGKMLVRGALPPLTAMGEGAERVSDMLFGVGGGPGLPAAGQSIGPGLPADHPALPAHEIRQSVADGVVDGMSKSQIVGDGGITASIVDVLREAMGEHNTASVDRHATGHPGQGQSGSITYNVPVTVLIDVRDAANQIALKLLPAIQKGRQQTFEQLAAAAERGLVAAAMGGI